MGTDIHAFVEYDPEGGGRLALSRGELLLPRDYALFHALAGVRAEGDEPALIPPRGLPDRPSDDVLLAYFDTRVVDDGDPRPPPGVFYMLRSEVEADPSYRRSEYLGGPAGPRQRIADPDWHTPSWLTYREVLATLDRHGLRVADRSPAFRAVLAAMAELAAAVGPDRVRLVFWFDN